MHLCKTLNNKGGLWPNWQAFSLETNEMFIMDFLPAQLHHFTPYPMVQGVRAAISLIVLI